MSKYSNKDVKKGEKDLVDWVSKLRWVTGREGFSQKDSKRQDKRKRGSVVGKPRREGSEKRRSIQNLAMCGWKRGETGKKKKSPPMGSEVREDRGKEERIGSRTVSQGGDKDRGGEELFGSISRRGKKFFGGQAVAREGRKRLGGV